MKLEMKTPPPLIPEYSEWVCEISEGVYYRPYKGREPKWWARLMHRVWLGFKWTRDTP